MTTHFISWFSDIGIADVALVGGKNVLHRRAGICGQAPSDYPEMAEYLVELGIDSMSVTPDTLLKITRDVLAVEARLGRAPRSASGLAQPSHMNSPVGF